MTNAYFSFGRPRLTNQDKHQLLPSLSWFIVKSSIEWMCACLMQSCGSMSICDFKPPVSQLSFLGMNENQPKTLTSGWNSPCCSATLLMGAVGVSAIWMPDRIGWYKSLYQIKCHKLRLTAADCTVKLDRCSEMTWNHRTGCTLWNHHWVLSRANYCCKVQLISLSYMHTYNKMIHSLYIKLIQKSRVCCKI